MNEPTAPRDAPEHGMTDEDYRKMLEGVDDYAFILLDADGHIIGWNTGAERILGYTADEIIGRHFSTFYPADAQDHSRPDRLLERAMADGRAEDEDWRVARDGRKFWATVSIATFRRSDGSLRGFAEVVRDMTERRLMEERLRILQTAVEQTVDGVAVTDLDLNLRFVNQAMAQMHNYAVAEVIDANAAIFHTADQMERDVRPLVNQAARTGGAEAEIGHMRRDGSVFPTSMTITTLKDADGHATGFVAVVRDIGEKKRLDQMLERQAREILEIATPVVQVWEGVVAVPLIGTLDSQRTQQLMERLLESIVTTRSAVALVDITAVPTIDTQTGRHLLETITATRLLGAEVILTGVRPAIAQTLVHLGIDLSMVITRSSLAAGLRVALDMVGLQISPKKL